MSWEDRDYAGDDAMRRRPGGDWRGFRPVLGNPMSWSVPAGSVLRIAVRIHVIFLIYIVAEVLRAAFGRSGVGAGPAMLFLTCLFGVVFVHEIGHCLACRRTGGHADEILMWPLGGLAFCLPPNHWRAHFVTAAGGPLVNVLILVVLTPVLGLKTGVWWGVAVPNPLSLVIPVDLPDSWVLMTLYLVNAVSLVLLLFNLLPMFPLDGGRIVQALLWPKLGYVRSMRVSVVAGFVGAIALGILGFVTQSFLLLGIALFGGWTCWDTYRQLKFTEETMGFASDEYARSLWAGDDDEKPVEPSARQRRRAEERALRERQEQEAVDAILQKIARSGMESLTTSEKRHLRRATRQKRQSD